MRAGNTLLRALLIVVIALAFAAGAGQTNLARAVTIECAPAASPAAAAPETPMAEAPADAAFPEGGGELTVFAAASLTDSFNDIKTDLEAANEGLTITYNFAGSQALVTQLTEGARADVFASASNAQMTNAVNAGVISGQPQVFTQNRLAIVVPKDNPAGIQSPADIARDGVKLVLAQPEVPVGQYARQSICLADQDAATYGEGFAEAAGNNVVSEEDNVKAVLTKIQLGEADAGYVYTTDVTPEVAAEVLIIEVPEAINVIAKYPIAPVTDGNAELANAFIAYVLGAEGQATLQEWGFEPKP